MKASTVEVLRHARGACFVFIAFLLGASCTASAQYTLDNTYSNWTGYNNAFLFTYSSGEEGLAKVNGGTSSTGFWEDVEEIEVAEDAYYWSVNNYPTHDHSKYVTEINDLCAGFAGNNKFHTSNNDWSGDTFNDDLAWAVVAFTRAYQITGNSTWLTAAEENFNTIWSRGQPNGKTDGSNGLQQSQPHGTGWSANLDSPVNFTFVIAGYLLYNNTGNSTYKSEADAVYSWAIANLYTTSVGGGACTGHTGLTCSKIYDSNNNSVGGGIGASDYTYNYGIAIQAATREGDTAKAQNIANWLMYNSNNPNFPYAGTYTFNGVEYEVLPNYGQGGNNNAGYNGIALRGVGFGYSRGALNATVLAWAQANVSAAWATRNVDNVISNNWTVGTVTPNSGIYAWDCSSALAGILDIPAP